ncbi:ribonuclease P protein component [Ureibacillus thermophilus]|uniref:Ribonuclease P protein component n=1 Tax=Ureibacillus thermophilus TaxID=367743 RepID=A0A4V1A2T0_9BACL|nr:ribonuclease P protein component [Ureibacillus thermophilus]QBK24820.1 ribonuclease P protein component [Ureibacillus thermophilus]
MRKRQRIKKDKEFQRVFKEGKSYANRQFVVYCLPKEGQKEFRIGLSVGKKIGNAVTRNQVKRYIRQVFLELKEEIRQDMDYIIIARLPAAKLNYHETRKSLEHVLKIAKVLNRKKSEN